jgi:DNA topoisomerase-3
MREDAGRCRAIADWAIGINLTAAATLFLSPEKQVLSVGRVITPTLNLIVEREKEILGFSSSNFYSVEATFIKDNGEMYQGKHPEKKMKSEDEARKAIALLPPSGEIKTLDSDRKKSFAPKPYSLSALQKEANEKYGFTAKETLDIAQKLYEGGPDGGYTTYPRTDSEYLTSDMAPEMEGLIKKLGTLPQYKDYANYAPRPIRVPAVYFDDSKVDGHAAIVTTEVIPGEKDLDEDQRKIYDLIAKSVIRLAYPPMIVENTTLETEVGDTLFKTSGTVVIDPGWTIVDAEKNVENNLPKNIEIGEIVSCSFAITEGKTEAPKRFTDATLIDAMEKCGKKMEAAEVKKILTEIKGIGRPSTRDSIFERLVQYKYIERKKKTIFPTPLGMQLMEVLNLPELKSPELTAKWEMQLDEIEKGKLKPVPFIREIENQTRIWCADIKSSKGISRDQAGELSKWKCPKCGRTLYISQYGFKCSDECGFSLSSVIYSKKLKDSEIQELLTKKRTKFIKGFKSKEGKPYGAYLILTDDFKVDRTFNSLYRCPVCEKPLTPMDWGLGCTGYKSGCTFNVPYTNYGRKLSSKELHQLITTGTTGVIEGFPYTKDPSKHYKAELTFDEDGKVTIVMQNRKDSV